MTRLMILAAIPLAVIALAVIAVLRARRSDAIADRGVAHQPGDDQYRFAIAGAHRDMALAPLRNRGAV